MGVSKENKKNLESDILGIRVDNLDRSEILKKIALFMHEPGFHQIATINPEFILEAQKNERFREILNNCDLNIADGAGIWFAFLRYGKYLKSRLAGVDLMMEILKIANDSGIKVFLAAKKGGLSSWEETRDAILKIYPNLDIKGENIDIGDAVIARSVATWQSQTRSFANAQDDKNDCGIVFVNFGAPHQEFFINSLKYANIRLAMGVGGSFDFLTGKIKRAPLFLRQIGLEWLWRMFQQKEDRWKRLKRIFRAVVIFPIRIVFNK